MPDWMIAALFSELAIDYQVTSEESGYLDRQPDGTLRDDSGKQIHVYEWNKKASRQVQ